MTTRYTLEYDGRHIEIDGPDGASEDQLRSAADDWLRQNEPSKAYPPAVVKPAEQPVGSTYDKDHWSPDEPAQPQPQASQPAPTGEPAAPVAPEDGPGFAMRQGIAFRDGLLSTAGAPVDLAAAGLRKLGLPVGDRPFLGSQSLKDGYRSTVNGLSHLLGYGDAALGDAAYAPKSALERYTQAASRAVGSSALPLAGTLAAGSRLALAAPAVAEDSSLLATGGRAVKDIAREAAKRPGTAITADILSSTGSGVGGQAGSDLSGGNPYAEAAGSLLGGLGGGMLTPAALEYGTKTPTTRFVDRQLAQNPHASVDAEIAANVGRLSDAIPASQRSAVLPGRIDAYERSLLSPADVAALDIPPAQKAAINRAWANRHVISDEDVAALRGTSAGDAAAEVITQARRLRVLIPEAAPSTGKGGVMALAADAAIPALGSAVAGPGGAIASRLAARALAKVTGRGAGQAARAAQALAAQAPRYAKVADRLASQNPPAAAPSLASLADDARDTRYLATQAAQAAKAREKLEAANLDAEANQFGARNDRDNVSSGGGWRGLLETSTGLTPEQQDVGAMMMVNRGVMSPAMLKLHLSNPAALQTGNAGNRIIDRLNSMADAGDLPRKPGWTPPEPLSAPISAPPADSVPIRNPPAYAATANGNQARVTQAIAATRDHPALSEPTKGTVGAAAAEIGNTSDRATAEGILSKAIAGLPATERPAAEGILSPLIVQKKPGKRR